MYQLIDPHDTHVEVSGRIRRDILVSRGYVAEPIPALPRPQRAKVTITSDVALVPWDELRVENVKRYEIPGLHIMEDSEHEGCWPTIRRCWERGQKAGATHHLVLTDDLVLADGFWDALQQIVSIFPESPISLFTVKKQAPKVLQYGTHWCISWGVAGAANVLPVMMIPPFLEWQDRNIVPECPHDDVRLTAWITSQRIGALTPVPCLVDHGEFPSVIEGSPVFGLKHSSATAFTGDVRGIDWTRGADEPAFVGISVDRPDAWLVDGRRVADLRS